MNIDVLAEMEETIRMGVLKECRNGKKVVESILLLEIEGRRDGTVIAINRGSIEGKRRFGNKFGQFYMQALHKVCYGKR